MQRLIYNKLLEWKNNNAYIMPLMVLGVRQCGKTYILNEFCQNEYSHYFYINLFEHPDIIKLYKSDLNSDDKFNQLKLYLNFDIESDDTVIFFDEIQESEELIAELKYFCEKHNNLRIVCAGSLLGVALNRLKKSFPVGKVKIINLYPMNFKEFLMALDENMLIEEIKNCYESNKSMSELLHNKALNYYKTFQIVGGMPRNIQNYLNNNKDITKMDNSILNDIRLEYAKDMKKYLKDSKDALRIESTYYSIPSQLANESNKFQFSKIKNGARRKDFDTAIDFLISSNLVNISYQVTTPEIPLEGFANRNTFKLFISDIGILNNMLNIKPIDIMMDNLSLFKGSITENYVANELIFNNYLLYYWQSNGIAEVDFLLYTNDGIIPIEVKASDNTQSKSLKIYMEKYNPKYSIRISSKNFGFNNDTKIKSIPLYAVFCLENN